MKTHPASSEPRHPGSVLLVALGAALWGTDTVPPRPLAQNVSSLLIVFYEHLVLAVVVLPVLWATRTEWRRLHAAQWAALLGIAWGGSAVATFCFTEAVRTGNPTTAVLLQKVQPLFTILLAAAVLGERLNRRHWLSLALALGGAYLVSFGDRGLGPSIRPLDLTAALLALAAAALWGSCTVLGRYLVPYLSFASLTSLRIVAALPLLTFLILLPGQAPSGWPTSRQAATLLWLALVPGLAALLIYYRGLRHTPASLAAIAELCFPTTTVLLNWVFLGMRMTVLQLAGFFLIWGVVWYLSQRPSPHGPGELKENLHVQSYS